MNYCSYCKVYIRGNRDRCILCENLIELAPNYEHGKTEEDVFPYIAPYYESHLALKIMIFITISALVMSVIIDLIFPSKINWLALFMFGVITIWLSLIVIIQKRYHIAKKIIWQVVILSALAIFWDYQAGWEGWSIDYVIPFICIAAMIIMFITAKIMHLSIRDYITYLLIDGFFGILPILCIIFDLVNVLYPSMISVGLSIISLSALIIFNGKEIREEITKRMHI